MRDSDWESSRNARCTDRLARFEVAIEVTEVASTQGRPPKELCSPSLRNGRSRRVTVRAISLVGMPLLLDNWPHPAFVATVSGRAR